MGTSFQDGKQETVQNINHPNDDIFYAPQWWWTGVFVPIVIAWIVNRKRNATRNGKNSN